MLDEVTGCVNTYTAENLQAWWTAEFKENFNVTRVSLLMDKLYGASADGLTVKIGDTLCATLSGPVNGAWMHLDCANNGVVGRTLRIDIAKPILVFCGL